MPVPHTQNWSLPAATFQQITGQIRITKSPGYWQRLLNAELVTSARRIRTPHISQSRFGNSPKSARQVGIDRTGTPCVRNEACPDGRRINRANVGKGPSTFDIPHRFGWPVIGNSEELQHRFSQLNHQAVLAPTAA